MEAFRKNTNTGIDNVLIDGTVIVITESTLKK